MLTRFAQIFNKEYRDLTEAQGFTVDDLITLSSMVEKEANNPNDFFKVSEVFRNRMKNPAQYPYMQSDATVLYQIHHETGKRPKHVTHDDTLLEVPYNTYTNQGLAARTDLQSLCNRYRGGRSTRPQTVTISSYPDRR